MKRYYSNIKSISWLLLGLTALAVVFYSSWFFLGNEETHNDLKQELAKNLFVRTIGFAMLSLPTTFVIAIIEFYGIRNDEKKYRILLKKINLVISITLFASFIGSVIFFFR